MTNPNTVLSPVAVAGISELMANRCALLTDCAELLVVGAAVVRGAAISTRAGLMTATAERAVRLADRGLSTLEILLGNGRGLESTAFELATTTTLASPELFGPGKDGQPSVSETIDDRETASCFAIEACIDLLSREPWFIKGWGDLGGMGQAYYHDAMADLIRARMVDMSAEPARTEVGDRVELKTGGPTMTVTNISETGVAMCRWYDGGSFAGQAFPVACLDKVETDDPLTGE